MKAYLLFSLLFICQSSFSQKPITFETSQGTQTGTYSEIIDFYSELAHNHPSVSLVEMGLTDSGHPLHIAIFDPKNSNITKANFHKKDRNLLLILNGIHAGEPDGIDATMVLFRDLAENKIDPPQNTIIATIPVYNIGGFLNRNHTFRPNQNGPEEYGFRGNARDYDLNRDFIKAETKNTRSFIEIFQLLNPDLFIDNHVSNGADYQYVLTHLFTQHNKLGNELGNYLHQNFIPKFESELEQKDWPIIPYVSVFNQKPEIGYAQFFDSPRYSTGYTALFNTLGMMVETHMLKPYKDRVEGTYELMKTFISIADTDFKIIRELRNKAFKAYVTGKYYPTTLKIDSTLTTTLKFKGFEGNWIDSKITGQKRLKFDRNKPFTKDVTYWNYFKVVDSVQIPEAYSIPKGYWHIRELLERNQIEFTVVPKDYTTEAEVYHIADFETVTSAFEGHYLHYNTQVTRTTEEVQIHKGDLRVPTNQKGIRYIMETLEPSAPDSFFNWNFFDAILQQKEGFSPYVWEDLAYKFLQENPDIKEAFDKKRKSDPEFSKNSYRQLEWIHKNSPYYETSHLRYPILRLMH